MSESSTGTPTAAEGQITGYPDELALTSDDFRFVYHRNPDRFFKGAPRPYRLIQTDPSLTTYSNAIYTPVVRAPNKILGCLYDENLTRIEASIPRLGPTDSVVNTDPLHLSIQPEELPVFDRPVVYLGFLNLHYGHLISETLSSWWTLMEELSDINHYLVHLYDPRDLDKAYVSAFIDAMPLNRENIVFFDEPVRLSKVFVPSSSFQLHSHIHTRYKETLNWLAKQLGAESIKPTSQPLYLSKTSESSGVRRYVGEDKIESYLAERGARIAHPGQLTVPEQVNLINKHECIIGFQGSQMHNTVLSLEPRTVIHFTDYKVNASQMLIDKCFDHRSTFVNVCNFENILREVYRTAVWRTTGRRLKFNGFERNHKVDYEQTISWLEASGLFS